jgi:hypothetical protein
MKSFLGTLGQSGPSYVSVGYSATFQNLCLISASQPDLANQSLQFQQGTGGTWQSVFAGNVSGLPSSATQWIAQGDSHGNITMGVPSPGAASTSSASTTSTAATTSSAAATSSATTTSSAASTAATSSAATTTTGSLRSCDANISANTITTCPFAENTFVAYAAAYKGGNHGSQITVQVSSPATGQTYAMACVNNGSGGIVCTGGTGAVVTFPLHAVQVY